MKDIIIEDATQGNLKHVSVRLPRNQVTGICGLSGSGKSTLAVQVIFQECQRQYLEALGMEGIQKPAVKAIHHASAAVIINQKSDQHNPRSSLGTLTHMYTDLRMIYEKLAEITCPHCHQRIKQDACKEETNKDQDEFIVYQYCPRCGKRMRKLTRTYFSFNTREGACPVCQGMGEVLQVDTSKIVDEAKSLEEGAISLWEGNYQTYMTQAIIAAFAYYHLPYTPGTPVSKWHELQKHILYDGVTSKELQEAYPDRKPPKHVKDGYIEGLIPYLYRKYAEKKGTGKLLQKIFIKQPCEECHQERLAKAPREASILHMRLPELVTLSIKELAAWLQKLNQALDENQQMLIQSYLLDLNTKIRRLRHVGLEYLSLDRQTITLSGGELQRIHLCSALDSDLTGLLYILDEPTRGLHAHDTQGILQAIFNLREKGNTVVVIEHDIQVLQALDHIIELGKGSGKNGGNLCAQGSWKEILEQEHSVIAAYLHQSKQPYISKHGAQQFIEINDAHSHNLKHVSAKFLVGAITVVSGVSGSGKSTLVFDELEKRITQMGSKYVDQVISIRQTTITRMKRSNLATVTKLYQYIRELYAALPQAKALKLDAGSFSFNAGNGRCERCEGMGSITSNLLFFEDVEVQCPQCHGKQFHEDVLSVTYQGFDIHELLQLTVEELAIICNQHAKLSAGLALLIEVGLGYVSLGQSVTTLSGGEAQRLKLARDLMDQRGQKRLYLIDEPTTGLHPIDIQHFLTLLHKLSEQGNTIVVIEHDIQVLQEADWIIDMGVMGGIDGGEILAMGSREDIKKCSRSFTAKYL